MADFIFELGSQTQASSLAPGDTITFNSAPSDVAVNYSASGAAETTTLTVGDQSLSFDAAVLSQADLNFVDSTGHLALGDGGSNAGLAIQAGSEASFAYGFSGADTITVTTSSATVVGVATVDGGTGADTITAAGANGVSAFILQGGAGDDSITGSAGNDHIFGNLATTVAGTIDGNDLIQGGGGNDVINGNGGNDLIGAGTFTGAAETDDGYTFTSFTAAGGNARLYGGNDDDQVYGGNGNDYLQGNKGDDTLVGGAGNDVIHGGQGDDVITGGTGVDTLYGDAGNNTFVFANGDADAERIGTAPTTGTDTRPIFYDNIMDFKTTDTISFTGGLAATDTVLHSNTVFATVADAETFLQTAYTGTVGVAALQVGADTFVFHEYGADATAGTDIVKLTGITASTVTEDNFTAAAA